MGAPVLLSPAEWEAIKIASIRGVSDDELAAQYDIKTAAIRKRRSRDAVWSGVAVRAKPSNGLPADGQAVISHKESHNLKIAQKAAESVTLSLAERGEQCRSRLLDLARKGVEKAHRADLPVTSWQDVKTVADIAAKAAGWDKADAAVSVNIWGAGVQGGLMCREVEAAEIEEPEEGEELVEV